MENDAILWLTNVILNLSFMQVLETSDKYQNIVQSAFNSDRSFARTLKESVEKYINLDARAAQYLSLYVDEMFKKVSE